MNSNIPMVINGIFSHGEDDTKVKLNVKEVLKMCQESMVHAHHGNHKAEIILPVPYGREKKFNRVRFSPDDRKSPLGIVVRDDWSLSNYPKHLCARFDSIDLFRWLTQMMIEIETAKVEAGPNG